MKGPNQCCKNKKQKVIKMTKYKQTFKGRIQHAMEKALIAMVPSQLLTVLHKHGYSFIFLDKYLFLRVC